MIDISIPDIDHLRQSDQPPHFFGLGFVQLKHTENVRYHFWHPDLAPISSAEQIHDHRYAFRSTVLGGMLVHQARALIVVDRDGAVAEKLGLPVNSGEGLVLSEVSCDPAVPAPDAVAPCAMTKPVEKVFYAGDTYVVHEDMFHTISARMAITRVTRGQRTKPLARVARGDGAAAVCPFSAPLSVARCWEIIEDTCRRSAEQQAVEPVEDVWSKLLLEWQPHRKPPGRKQRIFSDEIMLAAALDGDTETRRFEILHDARTPADPLVGFWNGLRTLLPSIRSMQAPFAPHGHLIMNNADLAKVRMFLP